eukprot:CAMPEP_0168336416 /NCGR_PEP_ID=MMETSP0213-20121227/11527_1 /TAXON_ID=151035 /ORGANISM="Euplotes harpa, Strain FSP1.4" /LENGTH=149 /DNA_ID=CAMNT_0008341601 /DNA_START=29 /DNA_END=478 /DNA_ORIENTATION=-
MERSSKNGLCLLLSLGVVTTLLPYLGEIQQWLRLAALCRQTQRFIQDYSRELVWLDQLNLGGRREIARLLRVHGINPRAVLDSSYKLRFSLRENPADIFGFLRDSKWFKFPEFHTFTFLLSEEPHEEVYAGPGYALPSDEQGGQADLRV